MVPRNHRGSLKDRLARLIRHLIVAGLIYIYKQCATAIAHKQFELRAESSAGPRRQGARQGRRTIPECCLTPHNTDSGPGMALCRHTGIHWKTRILPTFPPPGPAWAGPWWWWGGGEQSQDPPHPQGAPWERQTRPGRCLDAPFGAFKVGAKTGY